jgi:sirohydrochlorin ferrochelatase
VKRAILIVDHGSKRPGADRTVSELTALVLEMAPQGTIVEYAHMDFAEPTVEQGFARCAEAGASEIVVQPLMLAHGTHVTIDIPELVAQAASKYPRVRHAIAQPLGAHPKIAEIVMERCQQALSS